MKTGGAISDAWCVCVSVCVMKRLILCDIIPQVYCCSTGNLQLLQNNVQVVRYFFAFCSTKAISKHFLVGFISTSI